MRSRSSWPDGIHQPAVAQVVADLGIAGREAHLFALPGEQGRAQQDAARRFDQEAARRFGIELIPERLAVALLHALADAFEVAAVEAELAGPHDRPAGRPSVQKPPRKPR